MGSVGAERQPLGATATPQPPGHPLERGWPLGERSARHPQRPPPESSCPRLCPTGRGLHRGGGRAHHGPSFPLHGPGPGTQATGQDHRSQRNPGGHRTGSASRAYTGRGDRGVLCPKGAGLGPALPLPPGDEDKLPVGQFREGGTRPLATPGPALDPASPEHPGWATQRPEHVPQPSSAGPAPRGRARPASQAQKHPDSRLPEAMRSPRLDTGPANGRRAPP